MSSEFDLTILIPLMMALAVGLGLAHLAGVAGLGLATAKLGQRRRSTPLPRPGQWWVQARDCRSRILVSGPVTFKQKLVWETRLFMRIFNGLSWPDHNVFSTVGLQSQMTCKPQ